MYFYMYLRETIKDHLEITTSNFWSTKIWATVVHAPISFSVLLRSVTWRLLLQATVWMLRPKFCANTKSSLGFKYKRESQRQIAPLTVPSSMGLQLSFSQTASVQARRENRSYMARTKISLFDNVGLAANIWKLPCSHIQHQWLS